MQSKGICVVTCWWQGHSKWRSSSNAVQFRLANARTASPWQKHTSYVLRLQRNKQFQQEDQPMHYKICHIYNMAYAYPPNRTRPIVMKQVWKLSQQYLTRHTCKASSSPLGCADVGPCSVECRALPRFPAELMLPCMQWPKDLRTLRSWLRV